MNKPKKILVIRIGDRIGDTIIESFFIRELRKTFPQSHITWLTTVHCKTILEGNRDLDQVIYVRSTRIRRILGVLIRLPYFILRHYDLVISSKEHWRMWLITQLLFAKRIEFVLEGKSHRYKNFVHTLENLGCQNIDSSYSLFIAKQDQEIANSFLKNNNLNDTPYLVFNPTASSQTRTLSKDNVLEILGIISKTRKVVLLDYQKQYSSCANENVILCSLNKIQQIAVLIQWARYVLTVDTAITHIADVYQKDMTVLSCLLAYENLPIRTAQETQVWRSRLETNQLLWAKNSVNDIPIRDIVQTIPSFDVPQPI